MHRILFVAALAAATPTLALAQMDAASHNPAIKDPSVVSTMTGSASGRNSFTQSQAEGRIAKAGYTGVGKLSKDKNGVWRGKGMKDGRPVSVSLDYKGDVTAR